MCDWNGDGRDTPGAVRDGTWYLTDDPTGGEQTRVFGYGDRTDIPVCGDWNGDGSTPRHRPQRRVVPGEHHRQGDRRPRRRLRRPRRHPRRGRLERRRQDTPGIVRDGRWYLVNTPGKPFADIVFGYGDPGDEPILGDWDGNGTDTPGIVRNGIWFLTNTLGKPLADLNFAYGNPDDHAIVGDWNGDGKDTPGVIRFP